MPQASNMRHLAFFHVALLGTLVHVAAQTCPPGTEDMLGSGEACIFCSPGQYDGDQDPLTLCNMCSAGTVSSEGWTFCTDCMSGKYAPAGEKSGMCIPCMFGKYSNDVAGICDECREGEYDHDFDPSTVCAQCHKGSYSPPVSTACLDCTPGKYDNDNSPATECAWCAKGTYTNFTVFQDCQQCQPGQFDDDENTSTPCIYCPPGTTSVLMQTTGEGLQEISRQVLITAHAETLGVESEEQIDWRWDSPRFSADHVQIDSSFERAVTIIQPTRSGPFSTTATENVVPRPPPEASLDLMLSQARLPKNNRPNTDAEGLWSGVGAVQATDCQACTAGMFAGQRPEIDRTIEVRWNWPTSWIREHGLGSANGLVLEPALYPDCLDCVAGSYTPTDNMPFCLICDRGTNSKDKATVCEICPQGTYTPGDNSSMCTDCAVGQYGNESKASACVSCPEDTLWEENSNTGGERLRTCCEPGKWANAEQGHTTCYECANRAACLGNGECDTGFEGTWCASCKADWFSMSQKCFQCPENSLPLVIAAVIGAFLLSAFIVNIATTKSGKKASGGNIMKEVAATPMSILFTRLQVSMPVFRLGLSWPDWLLDMMKMFRGAISLDVSAMTAPECFSTGDPATMYLTRSITKMFVFPLLCMCMTLIFQMFQVLLWRPNGIEVKNYATYNSWVAAYSFLFVMLVNSGFEPFGCSDIQGAFLLDAQRELSCYEGPWFFIAAIGIGMLLVYGIIVPAFLFRSLLKMKVSHFGDNLAREEKNIELVIRSGWIYERYRPSAWYYEFVMIFQRVSSIGISNILASSEGAMMGWVLYAALTITCIGIQGIVKPYPEIVVDTEQLFNNPRWPKWLRKGLKGAPKYLSWNNMEKLGLYAQLLSLVFGLYYKISGDTESIFAVACGFITLFAFGMFIVCNLVAISLRIWALTREGTTFYEENTTTPLHEYAEAALLGKVFDEMSKGLDINAKDEDNQSPLFIAVRLSHIHIIRAMVNAGADPNLNCGEGRWTCLHAATNMETVQLLLSGGADPTLQDMWGMTAEDTHRQEAEEPPPLKKGVRQTQADRDKYRAERLAIAELIADKSAERNCDWAWKLFCPNKRTRRVTEYGKISKNRPKRPGMIRSAGAKEDIIRFYYRKFGSEVQVKETPQVLAQVLVGQTEEENWDLFNLYCKKLEALHGVCPKAVWKARTQNDTDESLAKEIMLDGYGGSGQQGMICAKAYSAEDYRNQRGSELALTGSKSYRLRCDSRPDETGSSSGSEQHTSDSDSDREGQMPARLESSIGRQREIARKLLQLKQQAAERKAARKREEREASQRNKSKVVTVAPGTKVNSDGASHLRSLSMLSVGEQAEAWVARETNRHVARKTSIGSQSRRSKSFKSLSVVDRRSFRSPSVRSGSSKKVHNRAQVYQNSELGSPKVD